MKTMTNISIDTKAWRKEIRFIGMENENPFGWYLCYEKILYDIDTDEYMSTVPGRVYVGGQYNNLGAKLETAIDKLLGYELDDETMRSVLKKVWNNKFYSDYGA